MSPTLAGIPEVRDFDRGGSSGGGGGRGSGNFLVVLEDEVQGVTNQVWQDLAKRRRVGPERWVAVHLN